MEIPFSSGSNFLAPGRLLMRTPVSSDWGASSPSQQGAACASCPADVLHYPATVSCSGWGASAPQLRHGAEQRAAGAGTLCSAEPVGYVTSTSCPSR